MVKTRPGNHYIVTHTYHWWCLVKHPDPRLSLKVTQNAPYKLMKIDLTFVATKEEYQRMLKELDMQKKYKILFNEETYKGVCIGKDPDNEENLVMKLTNGVINSFPTTCCEEIKPYTVEVRSTDGNKYHIEWDTKTLGEAQEGRIIITNRYLTSIVCKIDTKHDTPSTKDKIIGFVPVTLL